MNFFAPILFRVDAPDRDGGAPLRRCVALALALRDNGVESASLCKEERVAWEALAPFGFQVTWLATRVNEQDDLSTTLAAVERAHPKAIVVDSHSADNNYLMKF